MMDGTVVILQARMGSRRLPGKVLRDLGGHPMLTYTLQTLMDLEGVDRVVLATTTLPQDEMLEALAKDRGIECHRGPVEDVLRRFAQVAERWPAEHYLRATGDNPLVEPGHPRKLITTLRRENADYCGIRGLPLGGALEACTREALLRCDRHAATQADREHVTWAMKHDRERYRAVYINAEEALRAPDFHLTIDTEEDFLRVSPWVRRFWDPVLHRAHWREMVACWRTGSGPGQDAEEEQA